MRRSDTLAVAELLFSLMTVNFDLSFGSDVVEVKMNQFAKYPRQR